MKPRAATASPWTHVTIPTEPGWQDRPRASLDRRRRRTEEARTRLRDTERSRDWKRLVRAYLVHRCAQPLEGPVELMVSAVFPCPQSDWRKRTPRPERWKATKPDVDNVLKAVADAANGVVYRDDGQVARASVVKRIAAQGKPPYVVVSFRALEAL